MTKRLFALLPILALAGCRMCSDSCDYSPPVAGSPYDAIHSRAGSAFNGTVYPTTPPTPQAPGSMTTAPATMSPVPMVEPSAPAH
jgi:hypothetical protein